MKRSANRRKGAAGRHGRLRAGFAAAGGAILRNPVVAGGFTAFTVAFLFVSANALWYQPHAHKSAFFETRDMSALRDAAKMGDGTVRQAAVADPVVRKAQAELTRLDLYTGAVDGIAGPRTKKAVEEYQRLTGIAVTGKIDKPLLARLRRGADAQPAVALPDPVPLPENYRTAENRTSDGPRPPRPELAAEPTSGIPESADPQVVRIQAGLKAFGNDGIEIDGVAGAKTTAAIREFQTLFGLPVTGKADETLYAKMQEIGLTN